MQIVIDIPEDEYNKICSGNFETDGYFKMNLKETFGNAIPLPKGHGRLIILSEDAVKREQTPLSFSCQNWISEVGLSNATMAIIETDKESENG